MDLLDREPCSCTQTADTPDKVVLSNYLGLKPFCVDTLELQVKKKKSQ